METKKIFAILVFLVVIFGTLNVISAGWFDSDIEADSFKFAPIDGYSKNSDYQNGVQLTSDKDSLLNTIAVTKLTKESYDSLKAIPSPASLNSNVSVNGQQVENPFETVKTVNESNLFIISEKCVEGPSISVTTGLFEKNGSFYEVQITHSTGESAADKDIQIIKDIFNSIEAK